ncbi:cupin domain-containing protein [Herbiconiux sp. CPCC 205763]|uniref:Cupin domain-containing protein n=1 Tax=Herbiconiux aconitum TaxID=2970913 RepID=A0ABT2GT36_9MICO|nr:cupin domain-containing protein [Herbiconiux aconitum]MCS5719375.1 cupin domain-containing protein [Herbiconiux aconitum]
MMTVTHREQLRQNRTGTALFVGADHGSGVSVFWVDTAPGGGPDTHWHPYTETWFVLKGEAMIVGDGRELRAGPGAIVTVTANTRHQFRSVGVENLEMVCIHASPQVIQEFASEAPDN